MTLTEDRLGSDPQEQPLGSTPARGFYDVIIVGAGPAGIFAAMELVEASPGLSIVMIEKGLDIDDRRCPLKIREVSCAACRLCGILCGWGGAGAYSDGKLSLSTEVGGYLSRYIGEQRLEQLIEYVDSQYIRFGAPERIYGLPSDERARFADLAARNELKLVPSPVRHIGTGQCAKVLSAMKKFLEGKVEIRLRQEVVEVQIEGGRVAGVVTADGGRFAGRYVILGPGRAAASWFEEQAKAMGLGLLNNPVDVGVRVELPAAVMDPITDVLYEPKLVYHTTTFEDKVRTFCVNPHGEVVKEYQGTFWTVNGHSYAEQRTENTNFALLVSTVFTEPFDEPIAYGRYIAELANFLGKGVIVQRLGDLHKGRRSTPERIGRGNVRPTLTDATPGDLSFVLPYRYVSDILEMLVAMDRVIPGVNAPHTLLYGVEVKFYSRVVNLTETLETEIENLYAVGDGAGVSRGLVQASAAGVVAARGILEKLT